MPLFKKRPSKTDFEREAMPHLPALYAAAVRMTRNERDAEDLVQDALLRAFRFFDTFEAGTNCKAWLFRILTNVFCNKYREREREHEVMNEAESSDANLEQFLAGAAQRADARDAESALLGRMVSADVEKALAAVPQDFRMAVILADLEDFSYKEIAEIMDCPAGTVMSRLYRGRKILQGLLYQYAVDQGIITGGQAPAAANADAPVDIAVLPPTQARGGGRMNCAEADSFIPAHGDGELAGVDREQVERHLATCDACARRSRLQGRFKAAVRAHLPRPAVPMGLRLRVREALAAQPIAPRRWLWSTHPRLVPAAVALVLLVAITGTVRQTQSMVLSQAQRSYQSELPMDIVGSDCGSIASWFRGRVDFPVHAPSLGKQGTCQGGRLVNVGERPAAYIVYRVADNHRVAFLVFDPRDEAIEAPQRRVVNGREIYIGTGPGISTAAYRDRGIGYVVTSDLDEDALTRLVTASFNR